MLRRRALFLRVCLLRICIFLALFMIAFGAGLPDATDVRAANDDVKLAPELENTLTALIAATSAGNSPPAEAELANLARFMMSPAVNPDNLRVAKREHGEGVMMRRNFLSPFPKLVRYCFDPRIPAEVLYPMVLRRGNWLPDSQIVKEKVQLWTQINTQKMLVLRGAEYEEITPDAFSGCYYDYRLRRLVALLRVDGKPVLFSVSRQDAPSSVGRKAAIAGRDSDWNYIYTRTTGSNLKLVGWAETYMYDSANVSLMYAAGDGGGLAFFKWVRAGWSGMNMVKSSHIRSGGERFLSSMRQVLDAGNLPEPEEIYARHAELKAMDDAALRAAFEPHSAVLASRAQGDRLLSGADFQAVLKDGAYARQLGRQDIVSELMKLYMKKRLGIGDMPQKQ